MNDNYCNNEDCKNKYKCPIYHYVNEKVTNEFYLKKYNPKYCKYAYPEEENGN